jgi:hypothetical protein
MVKKREVIDVEATVVEVHGKTLFDRVTKFLADKDWGFHVIEEQKCLSFALRFRDSSVRVLVHAAENEEWSRILVYCTYGWTHNQKTPGRALVDDTCLRKSER